MVSHLRRMTRFEPRSGDAHKGVVRAFPAVHRGLMVAQYRRRHAGVTATGGRMGGPTPFDCPVARPAGPVAGGALSFIGR